MQLAEDNARIILLTGDLGFQLFDDFKAKFGPRYVNLGVAEAEMVCAAAGLAYVRARDRCSIFHKLLRHRKMFWQIKFVWLIPACRL